MSLHVVVGLGITGFSCVRYLHQRGIPVAVIDSREIPPNSEELHQQFPDVQSGFGTLDHPLLDKADTIILSPGLSLHEPAIAKQIAKGKKIIGDIELFAQAIKTPVISITGTNAKSTVTTLVGKMAENAGVKVQVGGNLGIPALDLLTGSPELFVLELSSFQLETTYSLVSKVATILNITPDHMDRYENVDAYIAAKQRVYLNCDTAICNRDDVLTENKIPTKKKLYFTLNAPKDNEFGLIENHGKTFLAFENQILLSTDELPILGKHYQANALAALALGHGFGLKMEPMLAVLKSFKGLAHRCQLVRELNGVYWYNDSKGTNVGATIAAIEGLGAVIQGKLILIAGGVGKNADFSLLLPAIKKYVKSVVLIGEAAPILANVIATHAPIQFANTLSDAVSIAHDHATQGDSVLLSPACASFDMFKNFEHRGDVFIQAVNQL